MNCANHPSVPAIAYCRTCGKPLCNDCKRDVMGVIYCEQCLAERLQGVQPTIPPPAPGFVSSAPAGTMSGIGTASRSCRHSGRLLSLRRRSRLYRTVREGLGPLAHLHRIGLGTFFRTRGRHGTRARNRHGFLCASIRLSTPCVPLMRFEWDKRLLIHSALAGLLARPNALRLPTHHSAVLLRRQR